MTAERDVDESFPELVPARMLNEFVYCPRLAYLEWVQGEWAPNDFTADGDYAHRRVDRAGTRQGKGGSQELRAVTLTSERLGLVAKADLVEIRGDVATPVDTKRGKAPRVEEGAYLPERVQVCAQGLILRDLGYRVDAGAIYFAGSKHRVEIALTAELVRETLAAAEGLRALASVSSPPPPLVDDPKCDGCSLAPLCLPDEVNSLQDPTPKSPPRPVRPPRADAKPLYVQEQGSSLGVKGDRLVVRRKGEELGSVRLEHTSHVAVFGGVQVSTQALRRLASEDRPLAIYSAGGWFYGWATGLQRRALDVRRAQFRAADDPAACLSLARRFVTAKISNQRTLIRRNHSEPARSLLRDLAALRKRVEPCESLGELLGVEGSAARLYWRAFAELLRDGEAFMPAGRNRRPPRDPVNAAVSFLSAILAKDATLACEFAGLDSSLGFLHQPRARRPALALDLMEEFRPLVVGSVVLTVFNTGELGKEDFSSGGIHIGVSLTSSGRRKLLRAYERRMSQEVTHPVFGYRITYRQVLSVQARLLGRYLLGEVEEFPSFVTR